MATFGMGCTSGWHHWSWLPTVIRMRRLYSASPSSHASTSILDQQSEGTLDLLISIHIFCQYFLRQVFVLSHLRILFLGGLWWTEISRHYVKPKEVVGKRFENSIMKQTYFQGAVRRICVSNLWVLSFIK